MVLNYLLLRYREKQYSVERLKELHAKLLQSLDLLQHHEEGTMRTIGKSRPADTSPRPDVTQVIMSLANSSFVKRTANIVEEEIEMPPKRDLSTAFRILSATPDPDKEGEHGGAVTLRDNEAVTNLAQAKSMAKRVAKTVRLIGEVVAFNDVTGPALRCDPVFEYFCEKNILSMLVEIAKAKPYSRPRLHGVTWSPIVKTQVLRTISMLVTNTQDGPSLYYLLSNNCVNDLLSGMLPLIQWTDLALAEILHVHVNLLKGLTLHLAADAENVFPFLKAGALNQSFPLLAAVTEIASSRKADNYSRSVCLNLFLTILQVRNTSVRALVLQSSEEQRKICNFLCLRMLERYTKLTKLTIGPVVDPYRNNTIRAQLKDLMNQLSYLGTIFRCNVQPMNVRLCEWLMLKVVARLLHNIVPKQGRRLLAVGMSDMDVIPGPEATAQTALVFLAHFWTLGYPPFLRMLAVALFHPLSTTLWSNRPTRAIEEYALTRKLNSIIEGKTRTDDLVPNEFRERLICLLKGEMGESAFVPAAMLLEGATTSPILPPETLASFGIVPSEGGESQESFHSALATFLSHRHQNFSLLSTIALERACLVSLSLLAAASNLTNNILPTSELWNAMKTHQGLCSENAIELQKKTGVSELFPELARLAVKQRYCKISKKSTETQGAPFGCVLDHFRWQAHIGNPDLLVRKYRRVGSNEVEDSRFFIQIALLFRAACRIVDKWREVAMEKPTEDAKFVIPSIVWADPLLVKIGGLTEELPNGTVLDLRGRTTFRFYPAAARIPLQGANKEHSSLRYYAQLVLVLGAHEMLVVKPFNHMDLYRGTLICSVSVRSIIAYAMDEEWLHIAVRNMEDVGNLIKNGNFALHFETIGECLIVKQFLEQSRSNFRKELENYIDVLLKERAVESSDNDGNEQHIGSPAAKGGRQSCTV